MANAIPSVRSENRGSTSPRWVSEAYHLGDAADESTAVNLVHEAIDGGVTFSITAGSIRGKSEVWLGRALSGRRNRVFLMTKVCTQGRDKGLNLRMLEESFRCPQTDHLDLWQIYGVSFENDPELFIRPDGAAEALRQAKEQGTVRFVGFTGHKDPKIHLAMIATGSPFDSAQMPLNAFDAEFRSFEQHVLPEVNKRRMAALGDEADLWSSVSKPRTGTWSCSRRR